jgi:hypothetical protein
MTAAKTGPLYPFPNRSTGRVLLSDGNSFDATSPNGLATYFGLYKGASGGQSAVSADKTTVFTIPSGATAELTVTITNYTAKNGAAPSRPWQFGFWCATSGKWKNSNLTTPGTVTYIYSATEDTDVSDIFLYSASVLNLKGSVELWVDDVQWI